MLNKPSIHERSTVIEKRQRTGDFEGDTIIGHDHKGIVVSQTTSKLKCVGSPCRIIYTVFGKPPVSLLKLFDYIVVKFQNNNRRRDADSISNTARLGRRISVLKFSNYYLTKSMRLDNISDEQIAFIENRLNNRPRKTLGWKTPNEILAMGKILHLLVAMCVFSGRLKNNRHSKPTNIR